MIFGGLLNLLIYAIIYAELGGDAENGGNGPFLNSQGEVEEGYYISGHFIHSVGGRSRPVSRSVWIYSYIHSISLWPTQGAMVICMLILARPHIIATMRENTWIRGNSFVAVGVTLTLVICSAFTLWFTIHFLRDLTT